SFHLHFGNYNATGAKWGKNENNYRHLTSFQWNTGMDLDAYNRPDWKNNVASLNIYVMNNEKSPNNTLPYNKMSYDEVKFFYRVVGNSAWKIATPSKSGDVYSYNVAQDSTTHGKDVQWMFRLKCNITSIYAFAPAYYYQPYADPNSTSNGYMFWTNKVVMPKTFTGNVSLDYALPFYIRNVNSGKYMTAVSVTSGGGDLVQKTFTGNTSQQFKLTSKGSGYYTITPMNATSLRVDVCNMNPANYSNVGLFTDNTAYYPGAQFFKFVSATTLYSYKIAPKCSLENNDTSLRNQVLEIAAASTADGADIRMWDYNYPGTKLNKEWLLQRY
ncbi:MAG: RICIN domain-containing protein, partial [Oscillospiraceae bacterium]|nr:RICIN domain-containing protein [Oscillospiraceae bacterium]